VPRDQKKAFELMHRAAEHGSPPFGCFTLGSYYLFGNDLDQFGLKGPINYAEGLRLARLGVERGDASCEWLLSMCYHKALGVAKDDTEGFKWAEISANHGDAYGILTLGICYQNGYGVPRDFPKAFELYKRVANDTNETIALQAKMGMGEYYFEASGQPGDIAKARPLIQPAADRGFANAMNLMGRMYELGKGVNKSMEMAKVWYSKAAKEGSDYARTHLAKLGEAMSGSTATDQARPQSGDF